MRVSWAKSSWTRCRIRWTISKNSSGSNSSSWTRSRSAKTSSSPFVELVEVHADTILPLGSAAGGTARRSRPGPEVVHVGSACRDIADGRSARLAARRRRDLRHADDGPARAAHGGGDRGRRRGASGAEELDLLRAAGADLMLVPLGRGTGLRQPRDPGRPGPDLRRAGHPAAGPRPARTAGWSLPPGSSSRSPGRSPTPGPRAVPAGAYLAVAWQGFLRTLVAGERVTRRPPRRSPILERADLVGVSHRDVDPETPIAELNAGCSSPGARLVVTRGHEGGLVVEVGGAGPDAVLRTARCRPTTRSTRPGPGTSSSRRSCRPSSTTPSAADAVAGRIRKSALRRRPGRSSSRVPG